MQPCTSDDFWLRFLELVSPQVDVILQAIALWVVWRLRTTYVDEQRTLSSLITSVQRSSEQPAPSGSPRRVRDRRRS